MKNRGVIVLSGTVLLLLVYAYFGEYKREINETKSEEATSKIVTLMKDQIQKIEIKKGSGSVITLERTVDGWNMIEPTLDQADNETIETFLDQITGEKAVDRIKPQNNSDSQYGFSPSLGIVSLINNNNVKEEIEISSEKNFEGLIFLRKKPNSEILTSSQTWTTFLTRPIDQFRNLRLFRGSISKVNSIKLINQAGTINFKYVDGFWILPEHLPLKVDQNKVREILTQLSLAKGSGLLIENEFPKKQSKPVLSIGLNLENEKWTADLYQDVKSKDVIGYMAQGKMTIRFPPQTLEDLREKNYLDFRDKTEPFQFDRSLVSKITARTKVKSFTIVKKGQEWNQIVSDSKVSVDSKLAEELIGKLNRLTVYRFLGNKKYDDLKLDSDISLYDKQNNIIFQISWSEFKNHEGFAHTNILKENFQIDDAQIHRLMIHKILKSKTSKQENEIEKN